MSASVTVTVSGLTGSGKSAVYGEIVLALEAIGVSVLHDDPGGWQSECHTTHADWQQALDMYRPTVTMIETNIPRKPPVQPSILARVFQLLRGNPS